MKLSWCNRYEVAQSIILLKGERKEGWIQMEETLNTFLYGKRKEEVKQVTEDTRNQKPEGEVSRSSTGKQW